MGRVLPKLALRLGKATLVTYGAINRLLLAPDRVFGLRTDVQDQRTAFPHRKWGV